MSARVKVGVGGGGGVRGGSAVVAVYSRRLVPLG